MNWLVNVSNFGSFCVRLLTKCATAGKCFEANLFFTTSCVTVLTQVFKSPHLVYKVTLSRIDDAPYNNFSPGILNPEDPQS